MRRFHMGCKPLVMVKLRSDKIVSMARVFAVSPMDYLFSVWFLAFNDCRCTWRQEIGGLSQMPDVMLRIRLTNGKRGP